MSAGVAQFHMTSSGAVSVSFGSVLEFDVDLSETLKAFCARHELGTPSPFAKRGGGLLPVTSMMRTAMLQGETLVIGPSHFEVRLPPTLPPPAASSEAPAASRKRSSSLALPTIVEPLKTSRLSDGGESHAIWQQRRSSDTMSHSTDNDDDDDDDEDEEDDDNDGSGGGRPRRSREHTPGSLSTTTTTTTTDDGTSKSSIASSIAPFRYRETCVEPYFQSVNERILHVTHCRYPAQPSGGSAGGTSSSALLGRRMRDTISDVFEQHMMPDPVVHATFNVFVSGKDCKVPTIKDMESSKPLAVKCDRSSKMMSFHSLEDDGGSNSSSSAAIAAGVSFVVTKFKFEVSLQNFFSAQLRQLGAGSLALVLYPISTSPDQAGGCTPLYLGHSDPMVLDTWRAMLGEVLDPARAESYVAKPMLKWFLTEKPAKIALHISSLDQAIYSHFAEELMMLRERNNKANVHLCVNLSVLSSRLSQFIRCVKEEHPGDAKEFVTRIVKIVKHLEKLNNFIGAKQLALALDDHFHSGLGSLVKSVDPIWAKVDSKQRERFNRFLTHALSTGDGFPAEVEKHFADPMHGTSFSATGTTAASSSSSSLSSSPGMPFLLTPETIGKILDEIDSRFAPGRTSDDGSPILPVHADALENAIEKICSGFCYQPCNKGRGCNVYCTMFDDLIHRVPSLTLLASRSLAAHREETLALIRETEGRRAFVRQLPVTGKK